VAEIALGVRTWKSIWMLEALASTQDPGWVLSYDGYNVLNEVPLNPDLHSETAS
jgi:hypothetical protein